MKIDITDVQSTENLIKEQQVSIDLESFQSKMGDFPIIKKEPFLLHLENQENKRLLISGETDVTLEIPCDRCLEHVPVPVHLAIKRSDPLGEPEPGEYADAGCIEGSFLNLDKLVYNEILIKLPTKVLCREDCKGICKKCGANLNNETCSCDQSELDPRMAAIQDIFHQFKEV